MEPHPLGQLAALPVWTVSGARRRPRASCRLGLGLGSSATLQALIDL